MAEVAAFWWASMIQTKRITSIFHYCHDSGEFYLPRDEKGGITSAERLFLTLCSPQTQFLSRLPLQAGDWRFQSCRNCVHSHKNGLIPSFSAQISQPFPVGSLSQGAHSPKSRSWLFLFIPAPAPGAALSSLSQSLYCSSHVGQGGFSAEPPSP